MNNFNTNIKTDDVIKQIEAENQKKNFVTFDVRNYLNTKLNPNEASKTLTIRLLPSTPEGGFPFQKVHMHSIKVNREVSSSGWKTLPCLVENGFEEQCPLCELSKEAFRMETLATSDSEKKKYHEIATSNRARTMYIVRCIERGHESDGVKFWLMSGAKDGPYSKIMSVWTTRYNKALKKGETMNIFDLNEGRDLEITIKRSTDGKNVYSVVDDDDNSPLTTDYELGMSWINDTKKWTDVYKVKPYEYMEILSSGDIPEFDKQQNKYVGRLAKQEADDGTEEPMEHEEMPEYDGHTTAVNPNYEDDLPY